MLALLHYATEQHRLLQELLFQAAWALSCVGRLFDFLAWGQGEARCAPGNRRMSGPQKARDSA